MVVKIAAPVTQNPSKNPSSIISNGLGKILKIFPIHKLFIAMEALPAPLKIPYNRKI